MKNNNYVSMSCKLIITFLKRIFLWILDTLLGFSISHISLSVSPLFSLTVSEITKYYLDWVSSTKVLPC